MRTRQMVLYWRPEYIDDLADEYVLLDQCIRRIENESLLRESEVVSEPINCADDYYKIREEVELIWDKLVRVMGDKLNSIHNTEFNNSQWKILLSPMYNEVFYWFYIYKKIKNACDESIYAITMEEADAGLLKKAPWTESMIYMACVGSVIWKELGLPYNNAKTPIIYDSDVSRISQSEICNLSIVKRILYRLQLIVQSPSSIRKYVGYNPIPKKSAKTIIYNSRFCQRYVKYIDNKSKDVQFITRLPIDVGEIRADYEQREYMFGSIFNDSSNEFERILSKLVIQFGNPHYIEGIGKYYKEAEDIVSKWNYSKFVFSGMEGMPFLMILALLQKKNVRTENIQHSIFPSINNNFGHYEQKVVDRFITWGWKDNFNDKIYPIGINRFSDKFIIPPKMVKGRILLIAYAPLINDIADGFYSGCYNDELKDFIQTLSDDNRRKLVIRTSTYVENSDLVLWTKKNYPYVAFEKWDEIAMQDSVRKSDMVVCSYWSTVYVECLIYGIHCVLFNAQKDYDYDDSFKKYYNTLKENEVIFEGGADIANKINETIDRGTWLYNKEINLVFERMIKELFMPQRDMHKIWCDYLSKDV